MFDSFFIIIFITFICEILLAVIWFFPYYNYGIVIYNKKIELKSNITNLVNLSLLESLNQNRIIFNEFNNNTFGFRDKFLQVSLTRRKQSFSRGLIIESDGYIQIKGYLNVSTIILILFFTIHLFYQDINIGLYEVVVVGILLITVLLFLFWLLRLTFEEIYIKLNEKLIEDLKVI